MLGLAFSGGGITAMICTLCVANFLNETFPLAFTSTSPSISTVSGGNIGYILFNNAPNYEHLRYPPNKLSALTYEDLYTENEKQSGVWFASALNYIPELPEPRLSIWKPEAVLKRQLRKERFRGNWWEDGLDILARLGYKIPGEMLMAGERPFQAGIALLREDACPIAPNMSTGVYNDAEKAIIPAVIDMNNGKVIADHKNEELDELSTAIQGSSFTSAFWAAPIVESKLDYILLKHALIKRKIKTKKSHLRDTYYVLDGGMLDTTGIVNLLRQKADTIVAFYNNNAGSLRDLESPLAYLFGVPCRTDNQNSIQGPVLAQVFPSPLYRGLKQNLTDTKVTGANMMAQLHNIPVLRNNYFGVEPYLLKSLVIFSLELSEDFLQSLPADLNVRSNIGAEWPNKIPVGMSTLEANLLCIFSKWKLHKHKNLLATVLNPS